MTRLPYGLVLCEMPCTARSCAPTPSVLAGLRVVEPVLHATVGRGLGADDEREDLRRQLHHPSPSPHTTSAPRPKRERPARPRHICAGTAARAPRRTSRSTSKTKPVRVVSFCKRRVATSARNGFGLGRCAVRCRACVRLGLPPRDTAAYRRRVGRARRESLCLAGMHARAHNEARGVRARGAG
jgi:hypothetical protein